MAADRRNGLSGGDRGLCPRPPGRRSSGAAGRSSVTVSPPPGVSDRAADPPLDVTSRCTMARPSPVPPGVLLANRRNAPRCCALAHAPARRRPRRPARPGRPAGALTRTWPPAGTASSALASRLSRICSRCPAPGWRRTGAGPSAVSVTPRSSAAGPQAATRSRHPVHRHRDRRGRAFSALATASSPSTSRASRAISSCAPASSAAVPRRRPGPAGPAAAAARPAACAPGARRRPSAPGGRAPVPPGAPPWC